MIYQLFYFILLLFDYSVYQWLKYIVFCYFSFTNGKHISYKRGENDHFEKIIAGGIILSEDNKDENSEESIFVFAANAEGEDDKERADRQGNVDISLGLLVSTSHKKTHAEEDSLNEDAESASKQNIQAIERLFNNKAKKERHHGHKSHFHDKFIHVTHHGHHRIQPFTTD